MSNDKHRPNISNDIWELLQKTQYFGHLNFQDFLTTLLNEYLKDRNVSEDIMNTAQKLQREQSLKRLFRNRKERNNIEHQFFNCMDSFKKRVWQEYWNDLPHDYPKYKKRLLELRSIYLQDPDSDSDHSIVIKKINEHLQDVPGMVRRFKDITEIQKYTMKKEKEDFNIDKFYVKKRQEPKEVFDITDFPGVIDESETLLKSKSDMEKEKEDRIKKETKEKKEK